MNIPIRKDKNIYLQTQCNINLMFKGKKNNEIKHYTPPPPKPKKKIIGSEKEIALAKYNSLLDIDELIR